ncbi:hypothetical protein KBZ14_10870 [Synechococcus sp. HJ21-Hayes]|jgi:hypothetical protein|uniref:hypothetical protein n=1 Tax=unclassified Synechococcus TaxID=2626047 RepID=UPI0020CBE2AB|nr:MULTISPECIES: hypothetical protein [unclassified Synechococcus]MCP9831741.1 hypothetical protein [Synechococcus sp. JJ3a-Johnson]MCP9853364.1 hypothetical protein [Synechococcus sp. HJ21-Hayes]
MTAPRAPRRWLQLVASTALLLGTGLAARAEVYVAFPTQDTLRQVQLAAMGCARENSNDTCQRSRALADPLLDHPRLPASCKDLAWTIRERSKPAAVNSFERREALIKPAQDLMQFCRSQEKPVVEKPAQDKPTSGFKLGGGK